MVKRIGRITERWVETVLFRLARPYLRNVRISGLTKISVPMIISIGRGSRLLAAGGRRKKNIQLEKSVWIGENVELGCSGDQVIQIKSGSTIQDRCKLLGDVIVERNCTFAPNVYISSGHHEAFRWPELDIRAQDKLNASSPQPSLMCHIEEDVWLGTNVFVKAGVWIGRGAVVGANSVVTKSVKPYSVVAGVPAKELKTRLKFEPPKILTQQQSAFPYLFRGVSRLDFSLDSTSLFVLTADFGSKISLVLVAETEASISISTNRSGKREVKLNAGTNNVELELSSGTCDGFPDVMKQYSLVKVEHSCKRKISFKKVALE